MNINFVNPWVLYTLWLVPVVGLWWHWAARLREKKLESFVSRDMQRKLRPAFSASRFLWQIFLITTGCLFVLIAAARPQWGEKKITVFQRGRDLIIALDVSRSMLANDIHPNRLQRAKIDIMDLIKELRGDRTGLIVFRHKAELVCPLTTDYSFLRQALDAANINSAPRGETDIGDALIKAINAFENEEGSHKAIILISDGEDLTGKALDAAEKAGEKNIPVFTVGFPSSPRRRFAVSPF
ncbi:VWA domain-containing protein, partial [Verrucomicrobiota bacterium]